MENDSVKKMEEYFEKQLEHTNYWLSFAEAKNAALLAFNIAVIAFVADFQKDFPVFSTIVMVAFIISSAVCLWSFLPNVASSAETKTGAYTEKTNLLFWKDIAELKDAELYRKSVRERYFSQVDESERDKKIFVDYSNEIQINSRIAADKYKIFKRALCIDFVAFFLIVILLILA